MRSEPALLLLSRLLVHPFRRLVAAALLAAGVAACGGGVDDLDLVSPPMVTVHGRIDPSLLVGWSGTPLRAALVWGAIPRYVDACFTYPHVPELVADCPDAFGFVPGPVEAEVEIDGDGDGTFSIPVRRLPPASVSVGSPDQSIAWGTLLAAADTNGNGTLDLLAASGEGNGIALADPALAASFFSLHAPQQRIAFREGELDAASTFYPLPTAECAPLPGFSILSTPGHEPPGLLPAPGECSAGRLEDGVVELSPLSPQESRGLACRMVSRGSVDRPGAEEPGKNWVGTDGNPVPSRLVCLDSRVVAFITEGDCPIITTYPLAGCEDDLLCEEHEWDLTRQPPAWWPCEASVLIAVAALAGAPSTTGLAAQPEAAASAGPATAPDAQPAPAQQEPAQQEQPPAPRVKTEKELVEPDDYRVRLSLPTEDDRAAWMRPGLRIELALEGVYLFANGPSPRIWGGTAHLRPRLRLDRHWSLAATFGYTLARGDFTGTRWTAVVEPIFHPLPSLGVSLAVGYGGLSLSNKDAAPAATGSQETFSRTLGGKERLTACSGGAFVGQARVEYLFVVGPMFSTGPYLVADGQWTACTQDFGRTDRETGRPVVGKQWWLNIGGAVGWWLSWR